MLKLSMQDTPGWVSLLRIHLVLVISVGSSLGEWQSGFVAEIYHKFMSTSQKP